MRFPVTHYQDHDPNREKRPENTGKIRIYGITQNEIKEQVKDQTRNANYIIFIALFQIGNFNFPLEPQFLKKVAIEGITTFSNLSA